MSKFDPNQNLEVFLSGNVSKIINVLGKSLESFISKNWQWYPHFLITNMPRYLGFYNRKMNWTFLIIFSSSSLKNWTKFSSSSFSKKVNWVQFKVHQKSELLNWTELFCSVQSLPWYCAVNYCMFCYLHLIIHLYLQMVFSMSARRQCKIKAPCPHALSAAASPRCYYWVGCEYY